MLTLFFIVLGGLFVGLLLSFIVDFMEHRHLLQKKQEEAELLIHEAQDKEDLLFQKGEEVFEKFKQKALKAFEGERNEKQSRLRDLQSQWDKKFYQTQLVQKDKMSSIEKMKNKRKKFQNINSQINKEIHSLATKMKDYKQKLVESLMKQHNFQKDSFEKEIKKNLEERCLKTTFDKIKIKEETLEKNLEKQAHFYLNLALNRFQRSYSPKRGIEPVSFSSLPQMQKVLGPKRENLNLLEKECGVDTVENEQDLFISIYGIDPVRRELGRSTLKKLSKKKFINKKTILTTAKICKKELFRQIEKDGKSICSRLRIKKAHPKVQNMLGALKYRYSFAQNQHFHCEEVGWLCGLLSSELEIPLFDGRRSGLLHDIGKAMDHAIEGNHAIIGADFISKYGEKDSHHSRSESPSPR